MKPSASLPWLHGLRGWSASPPARPPNPLAPAIEEARNLLAAAAAAGRPVPAATSQPILDMEAAVRAGPVPPATEQAFYAAVTSLAQATADLSKRARHKREYPFEEAVDDAELLLKHAAETGVATDAAVADAILAARTALKANALTDAGRAGFYAAYAKLSAQFGTVTAETIRNCSSSRTRRTLRRDRRCAVALTLLVATVSVITFVADTNMKKVLTDITTGNDLAARLRVGVTAGADPSLPVELAEDPCAKVKTAPAGGSAVRTLAEVSELQEFAATIRAVQSRSIKLNTLVRGITLDGFKECSPFMNTCGDPASVSMDPRLLQINAAILNYPAEILCRITTFQEVRNFATNVTDNYASIVGAFTSYALPILYALLGAYAFRLRQFADTILKRTYHPSFSDSARMITAVIAGAICGLFNPAQGLALSPLAVAFLVGYGVELFFKLLDTIINSFGAPGRPAK